MLRRLLLLAAADPREFGVTFFSVVNPDSAHTRRQRVLPILELLALLRVPGAKQLLGRFETADMAYAWLRRL